MGESFISMAKTAFVTQEIHNFGGGSILKLLINDIFPPSGQPDLVSWSRRAGFFKTSITGYQSPPAIRTREHLFREI